MPKQDTVNLVLDWIDRATVAKEAQRNRVNDQWDDRVGLKHATIALGVGKFSHESQLRTKTLDIRNCSNAKM